MSLLRDSVQKMWSHLGSQAGVRVSFRMHAGVAVDANVDPTVATRINRAARLAQARTELTLHVLAPGTWQLTSAAPTHDHTGRKEQSDPSVSSDRSASPLHPHWWSPVSRSVRSVHKLTAPVFCHTQSRTTSARTSEQDYCQIVAQLLRCHRRVVWQRDPQ